MKPLLLMLIAMPEESIPPICERFEPLQAADAASRAAALVARGAEVQAVLTNGSTGLFAAEIAACPTLTLIHVLGVGHEKVDVAAAAARGIAISTGAGTNEDAVADHALMLLLASVRRLRYFDQACRAGVWRTALPVPPGISGRRLGILGLGAIGRKVARRGAAFELEIGYHSRTPRPETGYRWFDGVLPLAAWCDFLVVATPGGAETTHLVDAAVLAALGPQGWLVNVARGAVVDTVALAEALRAGRLAGAGLDVYESEPAPPAELLDLDNLVLTPHVAGSSPATQDAMTERFLANADRHLAGEPLLSPL